MSKFYDSQVSSCLTSECQWKSGDDGSFTKENQWQQMFKQQELQEICAQSSGGLKAKCKYCGLHIDDGASHYFKRFKVCKKCSAAPQLIIEGRPHRFCQKCSKFEVLSAFDNAKKTCRERLLRHNELRRNKYKSKNTKNATTTKHPMKPQFQLSFFPAYPNYDYNFVIQQCQEKAKQVESLTSQLRRNESFESQESCVTDAKKCDNMPVVDKYCSKQGLVWQGHSNDPFVQVTQPQQISNPNRTYSMLTCISDLEFSGYNDDLDQLLQEPNNELDLIYEKLTECHVNNNFTHYR